MLTPAPVSLSRSQRTAVPRPTRNVPPVPGTRTRFAPGMVDLGMQTYPRKLARRLPGNIIPGPSMVSYATPMGGRRFCGFPLRSLTTCFKVNATSLDATIKGMVDPLEWTQIQRVEIGFCETVEFQIFGGSPIRYFCSVRRKVDGCGVAVFVLVGDGFIPRVLAVFVSVMKDPGFPSIFKQRCPFLFDFEFYSIRDPDVFDLFNDFFFNVHGHHQSGTRGGTPKRC